MIEGELIKSSAKVDGDESLSKNLSVEAFLELLVYEVQKTNTYLAILANEEIT